MASSQSLDDSPLRPTQPGTAGPNPQEVYNERHRLALEELLSGGLDGFLDFLRREKIPNFLSDDEVRRIRSSAEAPPPASLHGEEQALGSSLDCSSVTYFPDVSDVEPPLLELGWPAFTAGSYRGVTRAVAHFQPSYGDTIYSCKEAARRMIKSAREVIAIVTDSLTDLDIFKDLQEACCHRRVPVYILLDQQSTLAFLKMCRNVGLCLDDLRQMRVRTITGPTYYMRSGARITGKVHERFMLIDGNRVATGSYRFNWTDGKLNSSNLIELSGQITEKFDEEFRILYAQSLPVNTHRPPSACGSGVFEHLVIEHSVTSSPHSARMRPAEAACLTSTPSQKPQILPSLLQHEPLSPDCHKCSPMSDSSTVDGDWVEQERVLAGSAARQQPVTPSTASCHASTQTAWSVADSDTQTDLQHLSLLSLAGPVQDKPVQDKPVQDKPVQDKPVQTAPDAPLKDCFHQLTKERLYHYSAIRSRLEHMVSALSERRALADLANVSQELGARSRQRIHKDRGQEPNPRLAAESMALGTWPRARGIL